LKIAGHQVEVLTTTGPSSAGNLARHCLQRGADLILVAGGDGTVNEVLNGMIYSEVPLGVLPGGTANVFAMEMGIGKKMVTAAANVATWVPERVALGLHSSNGESRHFLLMCGAGLDAQIVYSLSASWKSALGKLSYWVGGFSRVGKRLPEFDVEADGTLYRASFALVSRVRNYGGDLEIAPSVSLLENHFEIVLFSGESSFRYILYMLGVVRGHVANTRGITILQATRLTLTAPEDRRIYTQIDGEYAGPLPATLEIVPNSLTLLMPPQFLTSRRSLGVTDQAWTISPTR
jgi:diacylglycerol kinase (ATP)